MKKVGVCACFEGQNNYGTMLQTYATLVAIKSLGYPCEIIRYKKKYTFKYCLKQLPRLLNSMAIKAIIKRIKKTINMRIHGSYAKGFKFRTKAVNSFKCDHFLEVSRVYHGYDALCAGSRNYISVVVGSDQLWLPIGLPTNFYNLMFVDDNIPKISYATSFGVSKIPFYQKKRTKHFLERLDAISVREISGKKIINSLTDKKVEVVVDPTLLLTIEQWAREIPDCQVIDGHYIFCYFLSGNKVCRKAARELKDKTGLKIVTIRHFEEYIAMDEDFGDEAPYDISPYEFVNLIRHADYVLTDSFHGTVFSVLHHKQFKTFYRSKPGSAHSRNSRIDSLFSLLGLEDRLYQKGNIQEEINKKIDYMDVERRLADLRRHSLEFLQNALKLGEKS